MNDEHSQVLLMIDMQPMGKARPRFGGGHAHMPKDYMAWKKKFAVLARKQSSVSFRGKFVIDIIIYKKTGKMRSDIDNVAGAILDALQDCGMIENDRHCWRLSIVMLKAEIDYMKIYILNSDGELRLLSSQGTA